MAGMESESISSKRLLSLDAFRGMIILGMISGGFRRVEHSGYEIINFIQGQFTHSHWAGLTFYDTIFPAFLFIVGVALPFSFAKHRSSGASDTRYLRHAVYRAVILFLLGSIRVSVHDNIPTFFELSSALQPIAFAYLVSACLLGRSIIVRAVISGAIILLYGMILTLVPGSDAPAGVLDMNRNVVWSVDMAVLGRAHSDGWGTLFLFFPQIANTLCGTIAGEWLRRSSTSSEKIRQLGIASVLCLIAGGVVSLFMPGIMKLWTPSYILLNIGISGMLLALFYWIIDVRGYQKWAFPFIVFGMNAIALYMGNSLFSSQFASIVHVFTRDIAMLLGASDRFSYFSLLFAKWLVFFWMYKRKFSSKCESKNLPYS